MRIGTIRVGPAQWDLTGTSSGSFTSGLDSAISATFPTSGSFVHVGPLFTAGSVEAIRVDSQVPADLPATLDFRPEPRLAVAALLLRAANAVRLYLPSKAGTLNGRWVDVPRTPEFLAMSVSDRDAQRDAWIAALGKVDPADWPNDVDQSRRNLAAISSPALRILLAYVAAHACPVTGVNQPGKHFRGGQTRGFTLPLLHYPVLEPDCYIRVISGREGLLESVNAYDLGAGVSLGSIQFNVHRAAIFQFLHAFNEEDPELFQSCFDKFKWSPKQVTIGRARHFALDAEDIAGNRVELIGQDTDHSRNCGYFQSGIPGNADFDEIDPTFRKAVAASCRDAVLWPHVQETVMAVSGEWLRPGLASIEAAGIPPVDTRRPDRDTFVLKALLLSAYVRYSSCLSPLLTALRPYVSPTAKLAAMERVLRASDDWSNCSRERRRKLADRIVAQRRDAVAAWEVIDRLAGSHPGAPVARLAATIVPPADADGDDSCDHGFGAEHPERGIWDAQMAAAETDLGDVSRRFQSLIAIEVDRVRGRKASMGSSRSGGGETRRADRGDLVVRTTRAGRHEVALVDAIDNRYLYVRDLAGAYRRWRARDAFGNLPEDVQVLELGRDAARRLAALQDELVFADPSLAVPAFSEGERRVVLTPLLPPAVNQAALGWNQRRHPTVSGVSLGRIATTLESYVDLASVKDALAAAHGAAAATDEAALVEAIHQFQRKTFVDAGQYDGRCGEATLDNLGLYLGRPGLNQVDVANPTAQAHLSRINRRLAGVADNPDAPATLNAANWFLHMTAPAFLGHTFRNGIHAVLLRRLRTAERHLLGMPAYQGLTPVRLGQALGIQEFHRGSRPTATTGSMHTFGLATDINYTGNPWITGSGIMRVLRRARRLVSGMALEGQSTAAGWLHANLARKATAEIYDVLWDLDRDFRSYLALRGDAGGLGQLLETRRRDGTPGIFDPGETLPQAAHRWQGTIASDLAGLGRDDGFVNRDPRDGFLNLARDLVIALRDVGCLAWGASDFGPGESGDIMHFDCRNTGLGRVINRGFAPPERRCP